MLSLIDLQRDLKHSELLRHSERAEPVDVREASIPVDPAPASAEPAEDTPQEFEIVLGRRQIASVLFLATVIAAVLVSVAYLAGKALSPKAVSTSIAGAPLITAVEPPPAPAAPLEKATQTPQAPAAPETIAKTEPTPLVSNISKPEPPIFAEPARGGLYIQMGAVERGVAIVFVEGLRKRGLSSFVAPGPNEKIFRVLIGPLSDSGSYQRAKQAVDQIGLTTFARRYEN